MTFPSNPPTSTPSIPPELESMGSGSAGAILRSREVESIIQFTRVTLVSCIVGTVAVAALFFDSLSGRVAVVGLLALDVAVAHTHGFLRKKAASSAEPLEFPPAALALAAVGIVVQHYAYGLYAPMAVGPMLGLVGYLSTRVLGVRTGLTLSAAMSVSYVAVVALVGAGVLPNLGFVTQRDPSTDLQLTTLAGLCVPLMAGWAMGVSTSRDETELSRAIDEAMLEAARKEALLAEARSEIDRAMRAGEDGVLSGVRLGTYTLGPLIGRGGMGEIYDASCEGREQRVAIKVLRSEIAQDAHALERFDREARSLRAIDSDHVVRILEVHLDARPFPYVVLERLNGRDLASRLRGGGHLPIDQTVTLVEEVSEGLEAVRSVGIVHRDIKPQNLVLHGRADAPPVWKIIDFGVAHLEAAERMTQHRVVGTTAFMAPEQASADEVVDFRADLYALAAVAYQALTGRPPKGRRRSGEGHRASAPLDPAESCDIPDDLRAVLRMALADDPAERFQSPTEMARAFALGAQGALPRELRAHAQTFVRTNPWATSQPQAPVRTDVDTLAGARP